MAREHLSSAGETYDEKYFRVRKDAAFEDL